MNEFMLLFHGGNFREESLTPEEMQVHIQKWIKWMQKLVDDGQRSGGSPLKRGGKLVTKSAVTDGPFAEGKEVVGGFVIINADNIDQAVEISKGCPIFDLDGTVEIREIEKVGM